MVLSLVQYVVLKMDLLSVLNLDLPLVCVSAQFHEYFASEAVIEDRSSSV